MKNRNDEIRIKYTTCPPTKQQKIEKIYEVIASNEYTGCSECDSLLSKGGTNRVLIGDVLDWAERQKTIFLPDILDNWGIHMRKPIEEQQENTIDYIFNLIKDD